MDLTIGFCKISATFREIKRRSMGYRQGLKLCNRNHFRQYRLHNQAEQILADRNDLLLFRNVFSLEECGHVSLPVSTFQNNSAYVSVNAFDFLWD
jgi:hypothetical protein